MVKTNRAIKDEPVSLGDRAADNLKFIRETMEGSSRFTAVPGYGGILMGMTAIAAALLRTTTPRSPGLAHHVAH